METAPRIIATALVVIALALLWQTVRHELEWWGYARYTALNPLELETESVVEELWTVNGDGRESISIELAPGLWTIELINPPAATDRTTVNLDGRQWGIGWTSTSAQAMRCGSRHSSGSDGSSASIPTEPGRSCLSLCRAHEALAGAGRARARRGSRRQADPALSAAGAYRDGGLISR